MPILPITNIDLINIIRAGALVNATDAAAGFNFKVTGSIIDLTKTTITIYCGDDNVAPVYDVIADINWLGAILLIPAGALITNIEIRAKVNGYNVTATSIQDSTGTDHLYTGYADARAIAGIFAPNNLIAPTTDIGVSDTDLDNQPAGVTAFSLSASAVSPVSINIRKVWDLTTQPGGGISKATLESDFTRLRLYMGAQSSGRISLISGTGPPGTFERSLACSMTIEGFYARITYNSPFSWTLNPTELSGVLAGDLITITSDDLLLNDLDITIGGVPIIPIIDDPGIVTFIVPPGLPDGPVLIDSTDPKGTQFSGSLPLGVLEVIGADVSGIYVLELGTKSDTLYNSNRDGSTFDRAIPNPFIETGFVGG